MFLGSRARPVRNTDNFNTICESTPWPVTGIALLYLQAVESFSELAVISEVLAS
jgi:hypothetical protein